jgi:hypothetical protein
MARRILYHVFTNGRDAYEDDYTAARALFRRMKDERGCARLYRQTWDLDLNPDEPLEEECLLTSGGFPE